MRSVLFQFLVIILWVLPLACTDSPESPEAQEDVTSISDASDVVESDGDMSQDAMEDSVADVIDDEDVEDKD